MKNNPLTDLWLVIILIIALITFVPLIIGVLFAKSLNATGLFYILTVLTIASLIWGTIWIYYYK